MLELWTGSRSAIISVHLCNKPIGLLSCYVAVLVIILLKFRQMAPLYEIKLPVLMLINNWHTLALICANNRV